MHWRWILGVVLTIGCAEPAAPAPSQAAQDEALARANAAADELGRTLRARLLAAMAEGGPAGAVRVCAEEAPSIARAAAEHHGARVGRSSLRRRNESPEAPAWAEAWLRQQGERSAEGVRGVARIEDEQARVLRPIALEGPCLACHGDALDPEVASLLRERYPRDAATGYRAGDLRGALWAEADVR